MSAGATMWRMCNGKRRYTAEQAETRATALNRKRKRRGPKVEWYRCDVCLWWHLGCRRHNNKALRQGGLM